MCSRLALLLAASLWLAATSELHASEDCTSFRRNYMTQQRLLNQQLDRKLFAGIGIWDNQRRVWQPLPSPHPTSPRARIVVLNFWAHYCLPCVRELPTLLSAFKDISQGRSNEVQLLLLAEETTALDMQNFLLHNPRLARDGYYSDTGGDIRRSLGAGKQLPVTVVLDRDLSVRYAIVGAIEDYGELKDQIDRLLSNRR